MHYSLFAIYEAPATQSERLAGHFREAMTAFPAALADGLAVDLFLPEPEPVVLFDDGPAPAAVLQFTVRTRDLLEILASDLWFRQSFLDLPAVMHSPSFRAFRVQPSAVAGEDSVQPRTAGLSFLVRYFGPMPDEEAFVDFYTAYHPPILGRLPGIRNVRCYLPEALPDTDLPVTQARFINEVVFDDVADLNAALRSDVIKDLRADSARFPPYGHSTHHAMRREPLLSQAIE